MIEFAFTHPCVIYLTLWIVGLFLTIVLLWFELRALRGRYDKFRVETAELFKDLYELVEDQNRRLIAAGQPPGRVAPSHHLSI